MLYLTNTRIGGSLVTGASNSTIAPQGVALNDKGGNRPERLAVFVIHPLYGGSVTDKIGASRRSPPVLCQVTSSRHQRVIVSPLLVLPPTREATMTDLITIQDLNTTINHEPRVQDTLLGEKLGYERPRAIRQIIDRYKDELETYGSLAVNVSEYKGQPTSEYWLNEPQAILLSMFSRTEKAAAVRKALIEVYQAYRAGTAPTKTITVKSYTRRAPQKQVAESIRGRSA